MKKKRGKFIVIEGNEGSGKSTQVKLLYDYFVKHKIPIFSTKECSDGPIGQLIRKFYISGERSGDKRILNTLFIADRLDHITNEEDGMLNFIQDGINVICDRYYMSSIAVTGGLYSETPHYWNEMISVYNQNIINRNLMKPDITFYIDTSPEISMERIQKRNGKKEIFDSMDSIQKIYDAYNDAIYILRKRGDKIFVINGDRSEEEVFEDIITTLFDQNLIKKKFRKKVK